MSIASEITRLQNAKADIKTAIENKGVSVPSSATLDEYDTYVAQISGGSSPVSVNDINGIINDYFYKYIHYPNDYPSYTRNSVTLYTPNTSYSIYTIFKAPSEKYRIAWHTTNKILITQVSGNNLYITQANMGLTSGTNTSTLYFMLWDGEIRFWPVPSSNYYYQSSDFDTIEECIQAIQSSSTTYTRINNWCQLIEETPYFVPYTNGVILDTTTTMFRPSQRISQTETIQKTS